MAPIVAVQQGDPLGPLLFCLVLHKVVKAIAADYPNTSLLLKQWYMDDGVPAGPPLRVSNALNIIHDMGPTLRSKSESLKM